MIKCPKPNCAGARNASDMQLWERKVMWCTTCQMRTSTRKWRCQCGIEWCKCAVHRSDGQAGQKAPTSSKPRTPKGSARSAPTPTFTVRRQQQNQVAPYPHKRVAEEILQGLPQHLRERLEKKFKKYGEIKRFKTLMKTLPFKYKNISPEDRYLLKSKNPPKIKKTHLKKYQIPKF